MSAKVSTFSRGIKSGGVTVENEPIIKSDGASSDVMEWQASTGTSTVKVREDASNNMDLLVNGVPVTGGASGSTNDGQGLHFDGAAGNIDIASPPDLGTKFSMEFVIQADEWGSATYHVLDFGSSGRMLLYTAASIGYNLGLYDTGEHSFGVKVLDDLKVHHIVITVDGTSAILYDNGNQVGVATIATPTLDLAADLVIGAKYDGLTGWFNGTIYRARFWNKTLSQAEVTASYENATVPFADQYGSQTEKVVNGAFASDTGWFKDSSWSIGSGVATADGVSDNRIYQNVGFAAGKTYRYSVDWARTSGTSLKIQYHTGSAYVDIVEITATGSGTETGEFTTGATEGNLYFLANGSWAGTIDNVTVVASGCVADYDLAFANPTQSLMVQDRAGAADGTSSATGVVQVTPIEQLNSKSARIGTSAATPADGEIISTLLTTKNTVTGGTFSSLIARDGDNDICGRIVGEATNNGLQIWDNTGSVINLQGGNVGIGGTPSDYHAMADDLVIVGTGDTGMTIASGASSDGRIFFADGTSGSAESEGQVRYDHSDNSMHFHTADVDRLTIDAAGTTTMTPTGNAKSLYLSGATATTDNAFQVDADSLTDGRIAYFKSNASSTNTRSLVYIKNDDPAATGTTCLQIRNDSTGPAISAEGGIVEVDGVLKSNLLSNSGFDVWSNSTLEDVGSELAVNGNFTSGDTGWTKATGVTIVDQGGGDYEAEFASINSGTLGLYQNYTSFVVGKLYKITATCTNLTAGSWSIYTDGGSGATQTGAATDSVVVEATATTMSIGIKAQTTTSTFRIDDISIYEVTPGCVAADSLGPDGWVKRTAADVYRQHDDATLTKDGSFYSLKCVASQTAYVALWPKDAADPITVSRFAGRTVTFGAWVYSTLATPEVFLQIDDGGVSNSAQTVAQNTWTWCECTKSISTSPSPNVTFQITKSGATAETFYISQPMVVFGSAIGSGNYSRPSGEIVWFENRVPSNALNATGFSDVAFTTLNTEADSDGAIPKGAAALFMLGEENDSVSSGSDTWMRLQGNSDMDRLFYASCAGLDNGKIARNNSWQPCDSNGDFQYQLEASGSGTLDVYLNYTGVQLR